MLIQENLGIQEKLRILSDAAKYDAACTSSEVDRKGEAGGSWAALTRRGSAIAFLRTDGAFLFSKFCLPTSAFTTANIVLTAGLTIRCARPLRRRRCAG